MKIRPYIKKDEALKLSVSALKELKKPASLKTICEKLKIINSKEQSLVYFALRTLTENGIVEYGKKKEGRNKLYALLKKKINPEEIEVSSKETSSSEERMLEECLKTVKKRIRKSKKELPEDAIISKTLFGTQILIEQIWNAPEDDEEEPKVCEMLVIPHPFRSDTNSKTTVKSDCVIRPKEITKKSIKFANE